jgi:hypothetical protein
MDSGEPRGRVTRRALMTGAAKAGVAAGAVVWVAPHFERVAHAATAAGSPPPSTTTSTTTGGVGGQGVTCNIDPTALAVTDLPFRMRLFGTHWAASALITVTLVGGQVLAHITTAPDGSFDVRINVPGGITPGTYQVECDGVDLKGDRVTCFDTFSVTGSLPTTSTTPGSTTPGSTASGQGDGGGGGGGGGGGNNNGGNGSLPFTGDDTRMIVLVGAGAVVVGRALYGLRTRLLSDGDGPATLR